MRKVISFVIFPILTLLFLSGCRQKDLEFPGTKGGILEIAFVWEKALDVSPEGMTVYFFPMARDGEIWRFDISGRDGGRIELPYGSYRMLAFNNDVPNLRYVGTSGFAQLSAKLIAENGIAGAIKPVCRAIMTVDWSDSGLKYYNADVSREDTSELPVIICHPERISTQYDIVVRLGGETPEIARADFLLHGVYDNLNISEGSSGGDKISVRGRFAVTPEQTELRTTFESFGCEAETGGVWIDLTVTTAAGKTYTKTIDVSDQLLNRTELRFVEILIDNLSIPDGDTSGGEDVDMDVNVDGWTEIIIDYITD